MDFWILRVDNKKDLSRFIKDNIWETNQNKFKDKVNKIKKNDIVVLTEKENIIYYATCINNYLNGKTIKIDKWINFYNPIRISTKGTYGQTISYIKKTELILKLKDKIYKLSKIKIKDFFSIKNIEIEDLQDKKEIYIVGENGDGKTLFLQALIIGLKGTKEDGLKEFREIKDKFNIEIDNKKQCQDISFAYGSSRNNSCQIKEDKEGYLTLFSGEYDLKSPTKWLIDLYNAKNAKEKTVISLNKAIELLQYLLNRDIEIELTFNSVIFKEKGAIVSFDQLSAGYKGVITIICDLIARLSEKQKVNNIANFNGIVFIDEIELHLHPKWQYSFMQKLRETFPLIQFIVTTHSPTILLGATLDAIYFNIYKKSGVIKISEQKNIQNDFLNDIQSSIFGFDVNLERIDNSSKDDLNRQKRAKEALLTLIENIEEQ